MAALMSSRWLLPKGLLMESMSRGEKGITVAVFQFAEGGSARLTSDYELTARLTRGWPRDDRGRFWAYSSLAQIRDSCDIPWPDSVKVSEIRREVRGVKRVGPIAKFLWVSKGRNDLLEIHPVLAADSGNGAVDGFNNPP